MKNTSPLLFICLLSFAISCVEEKKEVVSVVSLVESEPLVTHVWKENSLVSYSKDLFVTESHHFFLDALGDTLLRVYPKDDPMTLTSYALKEEGASMLQSLEFVKGNSRYPNSDKGLWLVNGKREFVELSYEASPVDVLNRIPLPARAGRSFDYHLAEEEMYSVPSFGDEKTAFYFFHPDSGYYRVGMDDSTNQQYQRTRNAYLNNMKVNESEATIVCAFRFFNRVVFYDMRGAIKQRITVGEEAIMPDNPNNTINMKEAMKCFIHLATTDQYVYCLYDGSTDYSAPSRIVIFDWKGNHHKTLQTDRPLKKIAVDPTDQYILALTPSENNEGQEVVRYEL